MEGPYTGYANSYVSLEKFIKSKKNINKQIFYYDGGFIITDECALELKNNNIPLNVPPEILLKHLMEIGDYYEYISHCLNLDIENIKISHMGDVLNPFEYFIILCPCKKFIMKFINILKNCNMTLIKPPVMAYKLYCKNISPKVIKSIEIDALINVKNFTLDTNLCILDNILQHILKTDDVNIFVVFLEYYELNAPRFLEMCEEWKPYKIINISLEKYQIINHIESLELNNIPTSKDDRPVLSVKNLHIFIINGACRSVIYYHEYNEKSTDDMFMFIANDSVKMLTILLHYYPQLMICDIEYFCKNKYVDILKYITLNKIIEICDEYIKLIIQYDILTAFDILFENNYDLNRFHLDYFKYNAINILDEYILVDEENPDIHTVDEFGNTMYHYICKNNIKITNKIYETKNKEGLFPRDFIMRDFYYYNFYSI